ncbi:MAG: hypothetical protein ACRDFC_06305 [Ignavibacteria bacterium]
MTDINSKLEQVKSKESFLEKIIRYIPGYDGYVNRDNSRELDTLLRNTLALNLDANKSKLKNAVSNLNSGGRLSEVGGLDKIDKKLENAIAKFKSAARGYSGAFDVVKIKEEKLNQLYSFDANLLAEVNEISTGFSELETNSKSNADIKPAQDKLNTQLDNLIKKFDERENLLRNL